MKKLLLSMMFMAMTLGAKAQFEKNTAYVSASATNLGFSYSSNEKFNFGMQFTGGYFI